MSEGIRSLLETLSAVPFAGLMLVVAGGYLLGRVEWRGLSLGPAGGTLLVALALGSAGLGLGGMGGEGVSIGTFGFALFIYSVGFEAGPRFFGSLAGNLGWRFALLGVLVNALAVGVAVAVGKLLALGPSVTAGMLSGALTSAPTFAAASRIAPDEVAVAVSFALTYPLGLVTVVLLVTLLPRWMGDDLAQDAEDDEPQAPGSRRLGPELVRAFAVESDEVLGFTLAELGLTARTGCYITQLHRGSEVFVPDAETSLEEGDRVMARGRLDELHVFEQLVGPEVYDDELRSRLPSPRAIQVFSKAALGRSLETLALTRRYQSLITGVVRGEVVLEPSADLVLERDDIAYVVGPKGAVKRVAAELGRFEHSSDETNIAVYAAGIFLGLLIGGTHIRALGLDFTPGPAVGLLLTGVLLGRFQRIGRFSAHVPLAARQLVRDLGILLFVAETGVRAGQAPLGEFQALFWPTLAAGLLTAVIPVLGAIAVARYLLRMPPVDSWGSVCGGMTSSAALVVLRNAADSNHPAISYAAAYAVASVLATLAGHLIVSLF